MNISAYVCTYIIVLPDCEIESEVLVFSRRNVAIFTRRAAQYTVYTLSRVLNSPCIFLRNSYLVISVCMCVGVLYRGSLDSDRGAEKE